MTFKIFYDCSFRTCYYFLVYSKPIKGINTLNESIVCDRAMSIESIKISFQTIGLKFYVGNYEQYLDIFI